MIPRFYGRYSKILSLKRLMKKKIDIIKLLSGIAAYLLKTRNPQVSDNFTFCSLLCLLDWLLAEISAFTNTPISSLLSFILRILPVGTVILFFPYIALTIYPIIGMVIASESSTSLASRALTSASKNLRSMENQPRTCRSKEYLGEVHSVVKISPNLVSRFKSACCDISSLESINCLSPLLIIMQIKKIRIRNQVPMALKLTQGRNPGGVVVIDAVAGVEKAISIFNGHNHMSPTNLVLTAGRPRTLTVFCQKTNFCF